MRERRFVRFVVPGELVDMNSYINAERSNRHIAAKIKKDMGEYISKSIQPQMKSIEYNLPLEFPVEVHFAWWCKDKRKDPGNIKFAEKYISDSLVSCGVLKGDGWSSITGFRDLFFVDKEKPGVVITLIESGEI